jgi:RNA polymerase sigma-70 factor (ECF subfamily)
LIQRQEKILQLLDTSGERFHRLLARITQREDVVGDLLQELFLRLWSAHGFDDAQNPFAYAYRTAVNLAFEWRRGRKKTHPLLDENHPAADGPSVLGEMIRAEELERALDATARLSALARDVVVMRYIEQASYEEIGQRLGKRPPHMRSVCAKAMAQLRDMLAGENE